MGQRVLTYCRKMSEEMIAAFLDRDGLTDLTRPFVTSFIRPDPRCSTGRCEEAWSRSAAHLAV
jgi:hypothetical protein